MAAEHLDPSMWATMQLAKPGQEPFKTVGEAHDRIKKIMATALTMAMKLRWARVIERLNTLAGMYEQQHATAHDRSWKRMRRIQADTMLEAVNVVRENSEKV